MGQNLYGKKARDPFPKELQYKMTGWYFGPGFTYTLPMEGFTVMDGNSGTEFNPSGGFGLYLEAGRYHIWQYSSLIKYMDYGLAYKWLRGSEENTGLAYSDHYATAHLNLNNSIPINKYLFIQNTVGINVDYSFLQSRDGTGPPALLAQAHYKFGIGFKITDNLMIIPAIETPILNGWPWENGRSTLQYLNSRYRPVILSMRFLFLRPKQEICPPVYNPAAPEGIPTFVK